MIKQQIVERIYMLLEASSVKKKKKKKKADGQAGNKR